jgi:hypothetical protein
MDSIASGVILDMVIDYRHGTTLARRSHRVLPTMIRGTGDPYRGVVGYRVKVVIGRMIRLELLEGKFIIHILEGFCGIKLRDSIYQPHNGSFSPNWSGRGRQGSAFNSNLISESLSGKETMETMV